MDIGGRIYLVNYGSKVYHIVEDKSGACVETVCHQQWNSIETSWCDKRGDLITTYQGGWPLARLYNEIPSELRICSTCARLLKASNQGGKGLDG